MIIKQAITTATRPLLRQIESLHHSLSSQRLAEEKSEKILQDKLSTFFWFQSSVSFLRLLIGKSGIIYKAKKKPPEHLRPIHFNYYVIQKEPWWNH